MPGAAKPELNFPSKDKSDVLHAFECALALSRVSVVWQSSATSRLLPVLQHQPAQGICAGALAACHKRSAHMCCSRDALIASSLAAVAPLHCGMVQAHLFQLSTLLAASAPAPALPRPSLPLSASAPSPPSSEHQQSAEQNAAELLCISCIRIAVTAAALNLLTFQCWPAGLTPAY